MGESTPFIEFMLEIITQSLKEYVEESKKSDLKSDLKILDLIMQDNKITIMQICQQLGMSESGVKKVIKKLKDENRVQRAGGTRGYWEVLKKLRESVG